MFLLRPCWIACVLGGSLLAPVAAASPAVQGRETPRPDAEIDELPRPRIWRGQIARDATLQFTARSSTDARTMLDNANASVERRAAAWMALGSASDRGPGLRALLERAVRDLGGLEKKAAVLALGELGRGSEEALLEIFERGPLDVSECALLALLRAGAPESRARVEKIAVDGAGPLVPVARSLLTFVDQRAESSPSRASVLFLELRWEAARAFGLIDGQAWEVNRIQALIADPSFLREVVLRAAPNLKHPCVRDHMMHQLLTETGHGRLIGAVTVMPREVSDLVLNELWLPKEIGEAKVLLDEIGAQHVEGLTVDLLARALEVSETHYQALALISRTGRSDLAGLIDPDLQRLSTQDRLHACQAMGMSGDPGWQKRLNELLLDADLDVRAHARVATMMVGGQKEGAEVVTMLRDPDHPEHAHVVRALCNFVADLEVAILLEDYLREAKGSDEIEIAIVLTLEGRIGTRARVRRALAENPPPTGARAVKLVRALRQSATSEDRDIFRELFPRPDEPELNVELAVALIELGDQSVLSIVNAALWGSNFDVSVLAAGLFLEIRGPRALREEVRDPALGASDEDVRRVGFAIGEWGGIEAMEALARELRYNSAHPALQGALLGALSQRTR